MFFAAITALFVENSIQSIDFMPINLFKNSSSFQLQGGVEDINFPCRGELIPAEKGC
jgi:hypothetical protein